MVECFLFPHTCTYLRIKIVVDVDILSDCQKSLFVDAGKARLVERQDLDALPAVPLDHVLGVLVGVEGVHEDERDVGVVLLVEVLDLLHGDVQEGELVPDFDDGLGSLAAHRCAEAAVQLHYHQLLQERLYIGLIRQRQVGVVGVLDIE